jgi:hypothetical protein
MCHPSQATRLTTSACQEREHHGIAGRDFDNISTYALNDSCAFVSEHDWLWHRVALVTCNHICVAQAGGHDLDQYFISARASNVRVSTLKGPPFSRTTAALICVVFLLIELFS